MNLCIYLSGETYFYRDMNQYVLSDACVGVQKRVFCSFWSQKGKHVCLAKINVCVEVNKYGHQECKLKKVYIKYI